MKGTSIFGGVQIFNIIISIFRSKIVAVLLGPSGMGIVGLLLSTTGIITSLTNFGLGTSAVRDIATANESNNSERIKKVVTVFRRLVWITGLLGMLVTLFTASLLSQLTFGNDEFTMAFVFLSITLLFNQLTSGQDVLLQGMRKINYLAKANMLGAFCGLLISLPLYYCYHIDGIVPAMLISSFFLLVITWYFSRSVKVKQSKVSLNETIFEGKGMLKMGFLLSLSGLITTGSSYIIRVFISNTGSLDDVGLYNAGFAIIGTYVGLVFTAMSTDYYPRLSAVSHDNKKATLLINQQAEIAILILAPILTLFLIFINWAVLILYSSKFIAVNELIQWAALGMYFKAASFSIGYVMLAKGASKTFFWSEVIANSYILIFNILGYKYFGLSGLGFSFLVGYLFLLFQVYFIAYYKYEFKFDSIFYKIFSIQLVIGLLCFMITKFVSSPFSYICGTPLVLISFCYSYKELNKRLGLKELISNYRKAK